MPCARRVATALILTGLGFAGTVSFHHVRASTQVPPHWTDAVRRIVLPNGLTLLLLPRGDTPIVAVQALYRVGSRNEAPGRTGVAHYVEHMAFRSTEGIAKDDLTNQILRWGGSWNGYTSYDHTTYASAVPSEHLDSVIALERERMSRVIFSEEEVARERNSVIAELREYQDWPPYTLIDHQLRPLAFGAHPYGSPIMGSIDDLRRVASSELQDFYRRYYAPNNLVLVIVGRFDPETALALVQRQFLDSEPTGRSPAIGVAEPAQPRTKRITLRGPGRVSHVEIAIRAPAVADSEFSTLLVADALLGGGKAEGREEVRNGSLLDDALVATNLATRVSTEIEPSEYPGLYSIGVEAEEHADLTRIESGVRGAIGRLHEATGDGVARATGAVRAALMLESDGNSAIADLLARFEGLGSYQRLASLDRELSQVTSEAVRAFAVSRLAESQWTIGWFEPNADQAVDRPRTPSDQPSARTLATPVGRKTPASPSEAPLTVPILPAPETRLLTNGLQALAIEMPGPAASLRIRLQVGAVCDPPERPGLAVLTGRLLSASARSEVSTTTTLEAALSTLNATVIESAFSLDPVGSNRHFMDIAVRLPGDRLAEAIELTADWLAHPRVSQGTLDAARRSLQADLEAAQDDSDWRAAHAALAKLYGSLRPLGRPAAGNSASLERITLDDVRRFHARWIRPERTIVAVAGHADPRRAIETIEGAFARWNAGTRSEAPPLAESRPTASGRVHVSLPHKEQGSIAVALPGLGRTRSRLLRGPSAQLPARRDGVCRAARPRAGGQRHRVRRVHHTRGRS